MKVSTLVILTFLILIPCLINGQQQADGNENSSLQADNGNSNGELDGKNDENANDDENKDAKPRKITYKEERFEKLFNNRHRKPNRLPPPKHHQKQKAKLPSFIKNPPSIKPLGQDGLPVEDAPRPTTPSSRTKQVNARATVKTTTTTSSPRTRSRASTTTTTAKPSINDSNKRFSSSSRGRISNSGSSLNSISSIGRGRLN